jgi:hypothetical protein
LAIADNQSMTEGQALAIAQMLTEQMHNELAPSACIAVKQTPFSTVFWRTDTGDIVKVALTEYRA